MDYAVKYNELFKEDLQRIRLKNKYNFVNTGFLTQLQVSALKMQDRLGCLMNKRAA